MIWVKMWHFTYMNTFYLGWNCIFAVFLFSGRRERQFMTIQLVGRATREKKKTRRAHLMHFECWHWHAIPSSGPTHIYLLHSHSTFDVLSMSNLIHISNLILILVFMRRCCMQQSHIIFFSRALNNCLLYEYEE